MIRKESRKSSGKGLSGAFLSEALSIKFDLKSNLLFSFIRNIKCGNSRTEILVFFADLC